jgi:addiction module HigA family antidote
MAEIKGSSFQPNYAVPPGETLRETLEFLGMTQAQLADRTGRPKKTINEIISGKAAITAETALQLERVLGVPASFWSNLERRRNSALIKNGSKNSPPQLLRNSDGCPKKTLRLES